MRSPDNSLPADVRVICGAMGSGKSEGLKKVLRTEKNVFVMDVKNEYGQLPGFRVAQSRADLVKAAKAGGRWAYPATGQVEFDYWCRVVWARGNCFAIAEELASLTTTAKASGAWHLICTQGRGYGIRVAGITQRPAEIDKTIIGNASTFRVHRLSRADDRRYMARELDVHQHYLDRLEGFDFIERTLSPAALVLVTGKGTRSPLRRLGDLDPTRNTRPAPAGKGRKNPVTGRR